MIIHSESDLQKQCGLVHMPIRIMIKFLKQLSLNQDIVNIQLEYAV